MTVHVLITDNVFRCDCLLSYVLRLGLGKLNSVLSLR